MIFSHHPDYTCLAQRIAFDLEQRQINRYGFVFRVRENETLKDAVRRGVQAALDARKMRRLDIGRLHVEIADDGITGRVIDHIPINGNGEIELEQDVKLTQEPTLNLDNIEIAEDNDGSDSKNLPPR